jgi:hypothetical protein
MPTLGQKRHNVRDNFAPRYETIVIIQVQQERTVKKADNLLLFTYTGKKNLNYRMARKRACNQL